MDPKTFYIKGRKEIRKEGKINFSPKWGKSENSAFFQNKHSRI